jgi:4-amino-4-deoxy-L-arabinose transferase-like glycosyltransferase
MLPAGLVWGLALLTKIHAWLLPPLALAWCLWRLGLKRGPIAFVVWLAVGLGLFFAGWPWLWEDTGTRLAAFLGTSVDRLSLLVQYFGTVYRDREVPWHYPWFYLLATVPVGLLVAMIAGIAATARTRHDDPGPLLWMAAMALLLVVFSTNAPVYDGERLFLPVFFLAAALAGRGFAIAWAWASAPSRARRRAWRAGLALALGAQGWGLVATFPFGLGYYNALVGGPPGAERLGLELTYWGDTIDNTLLRELETVAKPGDVIVLEPSLHEAMPLGYTTPALAQKGLRIVAESSARPRPASWVLVFRREAYWSPEVRALTLNRRPVALRSRQGVWLSGLWPGPVPSTPSGTTLKSPD